MDEFELDLKIKETETTYNGVTEALSRARAMLHTLRAAGQGTPMQIQSAEKRCEDLEKKRAKLRRQLEELEDADSPERLKTGAI